MFIKSCFVCGKLFSTKYKHVKRCSRECFYKSNIKHGLSATKFYSKYRAALSRCNNINNPRYKDYGGRGIKCLWESFEHFKKDMYQSYLKHFNIYKDKNTTLDRKDNNGNYCKENCRWATRKQQQHNRRICHRLYYQGKTKTVTQWAEELGINQSTLFKRLNRSNWSIEKALNKI